MPTNVSLIMTSNLRPYVRPLFSSRTRRIDHVVEFEEPCEELEMESMRDEEPEEETKNEWTVSVFKDNVRGQLLRRQYQKRQNSCIVKLQQTGMRHFRNISRSDVNYVFLWAAFHGELDWMKKCAEKGADVSFTYGNNNFNALHLAAMAESVECCRWLLEKGCRVIFTTDMMTPIHYAAIGNSTEVIKFLIAYGCGVPSTAINSAVYANAIECVKLLLSLKADVNVYHEGMTPLHVATDLKYVECMEELLNDLRIDTDLKTELKGYTALHLAAENGYAECIELLLSKGAKINEVNIKQQTPLHLACKMESLECVEILLKNRAPVNDKDADLKTPLHAAIAKSPNSLAKIQLLVRWKANVNAADRYGYTPLHLAALHESEECATFLILNGANVAAETKNGVSALNMINRKTPKSVSAIWKRLTKSLAYNTEQSLKFSFRELITSSTIGEIGFLYALQKEDHKDILMHPLCRAFLYLKWEKIKVIYFIRVFFVILTCCILSFLVLHDVIKDKNEINFINNCTPEKSDQSCKHHKIFDVTIENNSTGKHVICTNNATAEHRSRCDFHITSENTTVKDHSMCEFKSICISNGTMGNSSMCNFYIICREVTVENNSFLGNCSKSEFGNSTVDMILDPILSFFKPLKPSLETLWVVALVLVISNVFRNLSCKNAYPSFRRYLTNNLNLFEYVIMVFVITLFFTKDQTDVCDDVASRQKLAGTCVILLTWTYLTLVIGQLPFFGTYITMFNKVFKELLKLLTVYFCLLVGFMYTFSAVLYDAKDKFDDFLTGFAQTLVMMTGELEGKDLIEDSSYRSPIHKNAAVVALIVFIVVVNMALMNLLIGIAVSDVDGLRKTADLSKLVHQTKLIYYLEFAFFRGYIPKKLTFTKMFKKCLYVSPDFYRVVIYVRPLNPLENRLPQDIMKEALQLALNKNKPDGAEDEVVGRLEKLENKIQKIYNLVSNLSENLVQDQKPSKESKDT